MRIELVQVLCVCLIGEDGTAFHGSPLPACARCGGEGVVFEWPRRGRRWWEGRACLVCGVLVKREERDGHLISHFRGIAHCEICERGLSHVGIPCPRRPPPEPWYARFARELYERSKQ